MTLEGSVAELSLMAYKTTALKMYISEPRGRHEKNVFYLLIELTE